MQMSSIRSHHVEGNSYVFGDVGQMVLREDLNPCPGPATPHPQRAIHADTPDITSAPGDTTVGSTSNTRGIRASALRCRSRSSVRKYLFSVMSLSSSSSPFVLGRFSVATSETPTACFLHASFLVPGHPAGALSGPHAMKRKTQAKAWLNYLGTLGRKTGAKQIRPQSDAPKPCHAPRPLLLPGDWRFPRSAEARIPRAHSRPIALSSRRVLLGPCVDGEPQQQRRHAFRCAISQAAACRH